jgi:NAD(P)-dependent dehydrogenase (short-subunit alcohol dehydrogenase family)
MTDPFDLSGKVALVTGASRGLGEGMALALARAGADCVLVSRSVTDLERVAVRVEALGRRALALPADVADVRGVEAMVGRATEALGQVDILVNNAGLTIRKPAADFTETDWDRVLDVNLKGAFFTTLAVGRGMLRRKSGRVINICSLTSAIGIRHIPAYAASKGGLLSLTRALAVEWAPHGITVNAIGPGYFLTELTAPLFEDPERRAWIESRIPLRRPGQPADLGGAVVFLASDASAYVTGQILYVDGGWLAG